MRLVWFGTRVSSNLIFVTAHQFGGLYFELAMKSQIIRQRRRMDIEKRTFCSSTVIATGCAYVVVEMPSPAKHAIAALSEASTSSTASPLLPVSPAPLKAGSAVHVTVSYTHLTLPTILLV